MQTEVATRDDEQNLVAACLLRDERAWEKFCAEYTPVIRRGIVASCAKRGIRNAEHDDLLQNVYARLLDRDCALLRRFAWKSSLDTFLFGVADTVVQESIPETTLDRGDDKYKRPSRASDFIFRDGSAWPTSCVFKKAEVIDGAEGRQERDGLFGGMEISNRRVVGRDGRRRMGSIAVLEQTSGAVVYRQ